MDALKRRYETQLENASQANTSRYIQAGEDALAKNDLVEAATAFNVAMKFAPHDAALAMRAQEVKNLADRVLIEKYLKQAEGEEQQGLWVEASQSWERVARLRNDAMSHARAAKARLRSPDGDLHEAAEHAKRAIALQPNEIDSHITLVEIYLQAGLTASARRAAQAAQAVDPKHAALQALLKRIGKG